MFEDAAARYYPDLAGTVYLNTATQAPGCRPAVEALHEAADQWAHGRLDWPEAERAGEEARACSGSSSTRRPGASRWCPPRAPWPASSRPTSSAASRRAGTSSSAPRSSRRTCSRGGCSRRAASRSAWSRRGTARCPRRTWPRPWTATRGSSRSAPCSPRRGTGPTWSGCARRPQGALLYVDAAQAAGAVPLDMQAIGIDALAAPSHKFLAGTRGMGYGAFSPALRDALEPVWPGWKAAADP